MFQTLRSGISYDSKTQPESSAYDDETTREVETERIESSEENSMIFSPEIVNEKKKVSLEPLHAQIPTFTEMMDPLIQINSAKEVFTASSFRDPN